MSIIHSIERAFEDKKSKKWDLLYFYFDIHETIFYPDYENNKEQRFYKHAIEVLQYLSNRDDIMLGLYTCSYPREILEYQKIFKSNNINFKHVNKNPEVENTKYGFFEMKPYFNVLFENKAGFNAETDWILLKNYFNIY